MGSKPSRAANCTSIVSISRRRSEGEMPAIYSTDQSAPIRVNLTSSRLQELLIGQVRAKYSACHAHASKTRYLEKFKINISTRRIQTKLLFCVMF